MLKFEVDNLDAIDEAHKALYEKDGDKFRLKIDGLPQPEDTTNLKTALQKERKAAAEAAKRAKEYEGLGLTAEEIAALVEEKKKKDENDAKRAGDFEKLKAQMNEKHAAELKAREDAVSRMRGTVEKYLINSEATAAIAAEKGIPDLLLPHVQRFVKVVEQDGDYLVQVVDTKGDPRVNGKGEPLTISDLVKEMKSNEIFGRAFEGSGKSGSGTPPNHNGPAGSGSDIKRRSDFKDEIDRGRWITEHGLEAYQRLPF